MTDRQPLPPRLLGREAAAAYLQIGTTKFDEMVKDGRMPKPRCIDSRRLWDVRQLDLAIDALPVEGETAQNPWDDAGATNEGPIPLRAGGRRPPR